MEKMNFNRWALAITAVPTTLTSRFPTTGYARVLSFYMYKARARRNGYRMFISVYILCLQATSEMMKYIAHNLSRFVPKTSLNASLHGFSGIGNHMCT